MTVAEGPLVAGFNHVGVRTTKANERAMYAFYQEVLGLRGHPDKPNWLTAGDTFAVHLMPALWDDAAAPKKDDPARHFCLQVGSLERTLAVLLEAKKEPFQASLQGEMRPLRAPSDPLDFGIGTIFVHDPDGNLIEFMEPGRGIFKEHSYLVKDVL